MSAQGPTCALARVSYMESTPAKAQNNFNLSGPFLRRDVVPFYPAIDSQLCVHFFRPNRLGYIPNVAVQTYRKNGAGMPGL